MKEAPPKKGAPAWMATFAEGGLALSDDALEQTKAMFDSHRCLDDETCDEIAHVWSRNGYLIDPHTAIGTKAARTCCGDSSVPMVTLATAHPAKFPAAIEASGIGVKAQLPHHLADLFERPEAFDVLPNDLAHDTVLRLKDEPDVTFSIEALPYRLEE